jgi:hypothetical protein
MGYIICTGATLANSADPLTIRAIIRLFDDANSILATIGSGNFSTPPGPIAIHHLQIISPGPGATLNFGFPDFFYVNANNGDSVTFSIGQGQEDIAVSIDIIFSGPGHRITFKGIRQLAADPSSSSFLSLPAPDAGDTYLQKVSILAKFHSLMGNTSEDFEHDLKYRGVQDTKPVTPLTKDEFKLIDNSVSTIRLMGSDTTESDQQIYDETAMLCSAINARQAAIAKAQHPDDWDISTPANQLKIINTAANALFNTYNSPALAPFLTSVNIASSNVNNSYKTVTVKLDALVDLFKSLALPEDKLTELSGAVDSFVKSMSSLTADASTKGLHNAKLVNFFSIQHPVGNPDLAKVAKMRMFYLQFNEETRTWTAKCSNAGASGATYDLDVTVFQLDIEVNREICHMSYDHNKQLLLKNAIAALDDMSATGAAAGTGSTIPLPVDDPSPIGPMPTK